MEKIIFLFFIVINLFSKDYLETKKYFDLEQSSELIDVAFSENSIFVMSKYQKYIQGDLYISYFIKIQEYNFNFNLINDFDLENIEIDSVKYQYLPFYFDYIKDSLIIKGHFVEQDKVEFKSDHNLFVLKYLNDSAIYKKNELIDDNTIRTVYLGNDINLSYTNNEKFTLIAFKGLKISIRKYDREGNYITTKNVIEDSISTGINGNKGEVYVRSINTFNNNIHLLVAKLTNIKNKNDYYVNIYDDEFNFIKEVKIKDEITDVGVKNFDFTDKKITLIRELISGSSPIKNRPKHHLFKVTENGLDSVTTLGINYPDEVVDIIPFNEGYLAVGVHNQISSPPYKTTLIQKLNSDFIPEESFKIFNEENDEPNYAVKVKQLNENEYILVGFLPQEKSIYFAKLSTVLSVEEGINEPIKLFPNPTSDFIHIGGIKKSDNYEIYDLLGNKLKDGTYNRMIDVSNLTSGHYYLKLNEQIFKFIKK